MLYLRDGPEISPILFDAKRKIISEQRVLSAGVRRSEENGDWTEDYGEDCGLSVMGIETFSARSRSVGGSRNETTLL